MVQASLLNMPIESYSSKVAAKYGKISFRQLDLWVHDGILKPSIADTTGRGIDRRWSIRDICIISAIGRLRKAGIPPRGLKQIAARLEKYGATFTNTFLIYDGTDVGMKDGDQVLSLWKNPGQLVMMFVVSMQAVEAEVKEAMRAA